MTATITRSWPIRCHYRSFAVTLADGRTFCTAATCFHQAHMIGRHIAEQCGSTLWKLADVNPKPRKSRGEVRMK